MRVVQDAIIGIKVTYLICNNEQCSAPYQQSLSFVCLILATRERLHESSKIFVEHALLVARIDCRTQA